MPNVLFFAVPYGIPAPSLQSISKDQGRTCINRLNTGAAGVCGYTKTESWAGQDPGPQQIGERWKRPGLGSNPSGFCLLSWGNKGKS